VSGILSEDISTHQNVDTIYLGLFINWSDEKFLL